MIGGHESSSPVGFTMPIGEDSFFPDEGEGLTFDHATKQLLLLYNHGARIVPGMPKGFYDGCDKEISEGFVYDMTEKKLLKLKTNQTT